MSHFSAEGWFDFARGTLSPAQRASMQSHLDGECNQCFKLLEIWQTVLATVAREAAYRPPTSAVRFVKAAYLSERPWRWLPKVARMAQLVFDSFRQPAAAVRGSMPCARHFLHKADPFVIDVRVEPEPEQKRVWLMGQVLNSEKPNMQIEAVDVVLLSGERLLAKTATTPSGEFTFEYQDQRGLQLFINIRGRRAIGIVVPDLEI
ncbi:MAG: hypothetical protein ACJ74Z_18475 [Bryobacteraceae bacterium]